MLTLFAGTIDLAPDEGFFGFGKLGLEGGGDAPSIFNSFLSGAIGLMTIVAAIWFVFLFISGAIGMMTAGGDKAAMEGARKRIVNGLIGLTVVIAAIFVVGLFGTLLGFDLILNPAEFINNFTY